MLTPFEGLFLAIIAAAALGYALGRRVGRGEGRAEGLAAAPLALRTRALEAGRCPICGKPSEDGEPERVPDRAPSPSE